MRLVLSCLAGMLIASCGSEVTGPGGNASGGADSVDPECFEACVDKGVSAAECDGFCGSAASTGKTSSGSGTSASGSGSTTTGTGSGTTSGGGDPPTVAKACYECFEDNAFGICGDAFAECEESLACRQLRWCPFECDGGKECIEECNDIIPTGVEPLAEMVQCMACDGGPCAEDCDDSFVLAYCEF